MKVNRQASHPFISWVRLGNFHVTSQVSGAVLQTALATCSSE